MANVGSPSSVPRCPGILALFLASLLVACSPLPPLEGRPVSTHLQDTADTQLGKVLKGPITEHPGLSGVYAVGDGRQAFAARALLADAAERSLDVQNYIWHNDMSGTLMFQALLRAAERGVRVRLLLDDNNTSGLDPTLAALDAHPNIEVRLFNPFMQRRWRLLGYATDFSRLNRRMHNKSFTADNQATIVGGRNVGDEYFGAGQEKLFLDLDVIAVGPVVGEVSKDFDRYWASESAYPVDRIVPPPNAAGIQALRDRATQYMTDPAARPYVSALKGTRLVRQLLSADLPFEWVKVRMVSDDPAKGLGKAPPHRMITQQLVDVLGAPEQELELVSPYLVPTIGGVNAFTDLSLSGVKITVLTNSLAATDVAAVHAGYAKRRRALLEAGVTLYEMKPG
ncbi:MAG: phospholipase D family protein, partial [Burkholderiales bacterium]|nr:phospholipase D family protein [Burkholderiales bacterium]